MAESSLSYRINTPSVVSQTIDQETIIIHFDSGMYYSANETGAAIWSLIEEGSTADRIVRRLERSFSSNGTAIADSVARFIEDLLREELIVGVETASEAEPDNSSPANDLPAFSEPVLERYSDMADLLLLDPVHEIEDRARRDGREAPH